jgi:predicted NUDIX family phosphoesterase
MGNRQKKKKKGKKSKIPIIDGAPESKEGDSAPKEEIISILYRSEDGLLPVEVVQMAIGHNNKVRVKQQGTAYKKGYFFTEIHYPVDGNDPRSRSPEEFGRRACEQFDYVEEVRIGKEEYSKLEQMTRDTDEIEVQKSSNELIAESSGEMETIPKVEPTPKAEKKPDEPERILVVDRNKLFGAKHDHYFEGFCRAGHAQDKKGRFQRIIAEHSYFEVRSKVEEDPNKKQLIPYCVFAHKDQLNGQMIFVMQRLKGGGEKRLYGDFTIGIGGHINPVDGRTTRYLDRDLDLWSTVGIEAKALASTTAEDPLYPLWTGMRREFKEEVDYNGRRLVRFLGYINDDSNPVGKVHFGLVFSIKGGISNIYVAAQDELVGRLASFEELKEINTRNGEPKKSKKKEPESVDFMDKFVEEGFENWSKILYPHIEDLLSPK